MSARRTVLVGNWKMNKSVDETEQFIRALRTVTDGLPNVDLVLAPPFMDLPAACHALAGSTIGLAAQNMHWQSSGAFTGEVSGKMLRDAGCTHVIVAHSERRQYFGETNETAGRKLVAAHAHDLMPIYCVGETLAQREEELTSATIRTQVREGLASLSKDQMRETILAYEPIWAIGSGRTASPEQAQQVHGLLRDTLIDMYGADVAAAVRIQYGGSVKPDNLELLIAQPDIDGAVVGGSSLDAAAFGQMAAIVNRVG